MTLANFSPRSVCYSVVGANRRYFASRRHPAGFTLVEMLVAISITLVMMATVVGVFATVSSSVTKRQAAIEVGNQLRHVRNVLQRDLEGATCPALPWTEPASNVGYFEIVEGLHSDFYPSDLTDQSIGGVATSVDVNGEIDHATSTLPSSNVNVQGISSPTTDNWVTDGGGLGDYDDILAFTSRNEQEPFTGPAPDSNQITNTDSSGFPGWRSETISSPVAEVVWFCVENPAVDTGGYFGNLSQAGFRTIYRRTLLVAPWLDYNFDFGGGIKSRPGLLRIMGSLSDPVDDEAEALAALIAFQERYDISARIEYDRALGHWVIRANTLADLTDRKNRYEHHGFAGDPSGGSRNFPYVMMSAGGASHSDVYLVNDTEVYNLLPAPVNANVLTNEISDAVIGYSVDTPGNDYAYRPLAVLEGGATARVVLNEAGEVVHATTGLVPLSVTGPNQSRRGNDMMVSNALGFDVQVYDPVAPVFALAPDGTVIQSGAALNADADITSVTPANLGWRIAADEVGGSNPPEQVGQGAFVDLGYSQLHGVVRSLMNLGSASPPSVTTAFSGLAHGKSLLQDARLTRVYDTWNFGYENDGVNQDGDNLVDEGTNGFDNPTLYDDDGDGIGEQLATRLGPDDPAERETSPPYPVPLRAVQIKLRIFEPDSGQIREVTVRQHFVPE